MKSGIKNFNMLSDNGSQIPMILVIFGNENPIIIYISKWTEISLPGYPLLREIINKNSINLHRNTLVKKNEICGKFISYNKKIGIIIPIILLSSLNEYFLIIRFNNFFFYF